MQRAAFRHGLIYLSWLARFLTLSPSCIQGGAVKNHYLNTVETYNIRGSRAYIIRGKYIIQTRHRFKRTIGTFFVIIFTRLFQCFASFLPFLIYIQLFEHDTIWESFQEFSSRTENDRFNRITSFFFQRVIRRFEAIFQGLYVIISNDIILKNGVCSKRREMRFFAIEKLDHLSWLGAPSAT